MMKINLLEGEKRIDNYPLLLVKSANITGPLSNTQVVLDIKGHSCYGSWYNAHKAQMTSVFKEN